MARRGENIRLRKDGRWEGRVLKGRSELGKSIYASFYGASYAEVKAKIASAVLSGSETNKSKDEPVKIRNPFSKVLDVWLKTKRVSLKESSYAKYYSIANNHIKPALGKYPASSIDNETLNFFVSKLMKSGNRKTQGPLSPKTIRDILSIVKAALKFAPETKTDINIELPRETQKDMRVLSKEEQMALEGYLSSDMNEEKLGVFLCLYTGLRLGEVCALKWGDFNLQGQESAVTIRRTIQRVQALDSNEAAKTKIIETNPKSNRSLRTIPLPGFILEKLKQFQSSNPNAYLLTGKSKQFIEPRTYENKLKRFIAASGIKDANFHATRHTFATRCVEVGFDPKTLSEILGHADIRMTLERYVHPTIELKRNNMNKLSALH